MPKQYAAPQRLYQESLDELRKIERAEKRRASIPGTVDYLIRFQRLTKKLDKELYKKINFTLS